MMLTSDKIGIIAANFDSKQRSISSPFDSGHAPLRRGCEARLETIAQGTRLVPSATVPPINRMDSVRL